MKGSGSGTILIISFDFMRTGWWHLSCFSHSSFSRYAFLSDQAYLEVNFYSLCVNYLKRYTQSRSTGYLQNLNCDANFPTCLKSQPFMWSYFIDSNKILSPKIKRAWQHKDLKGWDFQQKGELAPIGACKAVKSEVLGSFPSGGNILLLDFFSSLVIL